MTGTKDIDWMHLALEQAKKAEIVGEVPVGAVLVQNNELIATSHNQVITLNDPSAHAEILALREAGQVLNNYRLPGSCLYVTLEPCIMCMGTIIQARIERLVFGATDPKSGAAGSVYRVGTDNLLNHSLDITKGVLQGECSSILKGFFKAKRKKSRKEYTKCDLK